MQRCSNWKHADGTDATVSALTNAMASHVDAIVGKHVFIYESDEMQVGIDMRLLTEARSLLQDLVRIDPRGGFFCQDDMERALEALLLEKGRAGEFLEKTATQNRPADDVRNHVAYKLRVMLAHVRIKYDTSSATSKPSTLSPIFALMGKGPRGESSDARSQRRAKRLSKRPHPFINFRETEADSSETTSDADEPTVVGRFWDGKRKRAHMLLSDGVKVDADFFEKGEDGCAQARWAHDDSTLALEIPNSCVDDEMGTIRDWVPVIKTGGKQRKKPAAAATERIADSSGVGGAAKDDAGWAGSDAETVPGDPDNMRKQEVAEEEGEGEKLDATSEGDGQAGFPLYLNRCCVQPFFFYTPAKPKLEAYI